MSTPCPGEKPRINIGETPTGGTRVDSMSEGFRNYRLPYQDVIDDCVCKYVQTVYKISKLGLPLACSARTSSTTQAQPCGRSQVGPARRNLVSANKFFAVRWDVRDFIASSRQDAWRPTRAKGMEKSASSAISTLLPSVVRGSPPRFDSPVACAISGPAARSEPLG